MQDTRNCCGYMKYQRW